MIPISLNIIHSRLNRRWKDEGNDKNDLTGFVEVLYQACWFKCLRLHCIIGTFGFNVLIQLAELISSIVWSLCCDLSVNYSTNCDCYTQTCNLARADLLKLTSSDDHKPKFRCFWPTWVNQVIMENVYVYVCIISARPPDAIAFPT